MEKEKINRINELARKKKEGSITQEEQEEHEALRKEYITGFRENLRQVLDNTVIQHPDGSRTKLRRKEPAES